MDVGLASCDGGAGHLLVALRTANDMIIASQTSCRACDEGSQALSNARDKIGATRQMLALQSRADGTTVAVECFER